MPLYSAILLISVSVPLIFSFDKKVGFYHYWKTLFPSMIAAGSVFLAADVIFVNKGVWGFNPAHHSGLLLLNLPIEEWLFYFLIPYACVFTHVVLISYFPNVRLSDKTVIFVSFVIVLTLLFIIVLYHDRSYTVFIFTILIVSVIASLAAKTRVLNTYYLTFLVILIPFLIVNSVLTGSFVSDPVFWYDKSGILGLRLFTVPLEDAGFAFSLILLVLSIMNLLQRITIFKTRGVLWI